MSKDNISSFAYFGGQPLFTEKLHVGRPNIGSHTAFIDRVQDALDRAWLSNQGPYVTELEKTIADYLGVKNAVAVCNGTVGLEIAARAIGLKGEVIVPSFTFVATPHSLQWQEITPVFCDIDPETHNIDAAKIEELITPRTTGILGVHLWGRPCQIEILEDICRRHNLQLLFDASHGFGCSYKGKMLGNFGAAEVFSFHATKFFNSLEGGAIATNSDELADKMRLMRNFGFAGNDNVVYVGTNGKMNEIAGAMGLTSFESIEEFIAHNQGNYEAYGEGLEGVPGIRLMPYDVKERNNFQYIIVEFDQSKTQLSRDQIVDLLSAENVLARRYFYPGCHKMEPYKSYFPHSGLLLEKTESLAQMVISLPNGVAINRDHIDKITGFLRQAITNGSEVSTMMSQKHVA